MRRARRRRAAQLFATEGSATAAATCPAGTRVLLGGARVKFSRRGAPRTVISNERLISKRTWRIRAYRFGKRTAGPAGQRGHVTALAYCAGARRLHAVSATTTVPPSSNGEATATCPRGSNVLFGGYRAALTRRHFDPALVVVSLQSPTHRMAKAFNLGPRKPGVLRAFAYCR